ncbi:nuclear protein localization protein 4 homolog [Aplysia californica]|uniref:Nuclear protein localization protein 4 homolog n=1 Tax=Aplysia californica TaxID=6500 RepID=A0ABM0JEK6_APLCA|nr:nuclear protein localization protein 4 homolog [Aplysia californica]
MSSIVIRIQSPEHGTKRIDAKASENITSFLERVQALFSLGDTGWELYKDRNKKTFMRASRSRKLTDYQIRHGDMLFMELSNRQRNDSEASSGSNQVSAVNSETRLASVASDVHEDEIDRLLRGEDGKIYRKRNEQLCRHGPQGKCLHCVPLEPYDQEFLSKCDPPIKFLSFHSYIRKLTGGVDKGKFVNLENMSCKIKPGCKEHPPWPGGICTKCQPNAVTLNRQEYRHVDNIMFENPAVADRFLNYWRQSGSQRIGILFGRYEMFKEVPLGIRAKVAAIYEPPQETSVNRIELKPDPNEALVLAAAEKIGLQPVGWIFTDLVADDLSKGTVKNFRGNIDSHFLSSEECIMAADFQNKFPNPCRLSPDGHFGSKFVTVVVTGDNDNQIHFEGYQVSNQCMALVRDDCLLPTKDVPQLGYVKESSNEQYVPDVFYKEKDNYGNEVTQLARPLPVEYLLTTLPAAFASDFHYTFKSNIQNTENFPVENRENIGHRQDFAALTSYLEKFPPNKFLEAMSDFHLLMFLATSDMLPLKEKMQILLEAVKNHDESKALEFKKTEEWATVEEMMSAHEPGASLASGGGAEGSSSSSGQSGGGMWTCAHCTFLNQPAHNSCDICSLPRS